MSRTVAAADAILRAVAIGAACLAPGCFSRMWHVDYLEITRGAPRPEASVAWLAAPPERPFRELGVFEGHSAYGIGSAELTREEMQEEMSSRAATVGCDALIELPSPMTASSPQEACSNPPPLVRAVCVQWHD